MKKLLVLFFLLIFCSIAQAYTIQDGIKCTMGSDPLLNTDTEGATFTCVNTSATGTPVLTGCADTATGLCLLTAYSASCSQPSSCVKVERFTVKTVSGTTTYTFTIKARDLYDSRRSSANWVQGDKVEMIHMAGEDNNPNIPGTVTLPPTTSSTTGVIYKDTNPFIHNYAATNTWGWNTFIGVNSGNFTMARGAYEK